MVAAKIVLSQLAPAVLPAALPNSGSSLVRRLVAAENDPAKRRIHAWLANLGDERLSRLGLTSRDIVILRGTQEPHPAETRRKTGLSLSNSRPDKRHA
jgi:hypothetical protein